MTDSKIKFMKMLETSEEDIYQKMAEEDRKDRFEDEKEQASKDIRLGLKGVRDLKSAIRNMENDPDVFDIGDLADARLAVKFEEEKIEEMKAIYKDFFGEDFK